VRLHLCLRRLQNLCGVLLAEGVHHFDALIPVHFLEQFRQVGGVNRLQPIAGEAQFQRRHRTAERGDDGPGERVLAQWPAEARQQPAHRALRAEPAQQPGGAHVHAGEHQVAVGRGKQQVIDLDQAHALGVHNLLVQQGFPEEHFVGLEGPRGQRGAVGA